MVFFPLCLSLVGKYKDATGIGGGGSINAGGGGLLMDLCKLQ